MKTVNFIDAVNSGKRFRLKTFINSDVEDDFGDFMSVMGVVEGLNQYAQGMHVRFFSAQFELEEKTITITESAFDEALDTVRSGDAVFCLDRSYLKKELGF